MPHTWTAKSYSFPLAPHLSLIQECSLPRSPASLFLILEKQIRWKDYINFENKVFFCFCFFFKLTYYFNWRLITLQYCSGFLPYIDMNQPWVYMCSPSWTPLPPPSPSHPSGSSSCTSPEYPVTCIEPGLVIYFTYDNIHVSVLFSQIIPPSPFVF